ncbi:hypothetical protein Q4488_06935 [Amphritea sp. 1_MG-2023]|uniref:hypothetical protein n=1 Tax=Amphritea sp. 1_MG-2023 TaxID=3062670 RepID=UPI0026E16FCF|nr:hypothetical protein [Amphritea sp. 1_MG-2023]MDO6563120.1 hypothetical protein [Amphritea sp. 1_MG-2023]
MSAINSQTSNPLLSLLPRDFRSQLLAMAVMLGVVAGVIFILIQPLFGMDTLTSRHAQSYQALGDWGQVTAIMMAWTAHLAVSVLYGLMCAVLVLSTSRLTMITLVTLLFSWITTIIAPPANAMIVQLVSLQQLQLDKLPGFNLSLDVKFILHLFFFAAISAVLYGYSKRVQCT